MKVKTLFCFVLIFFNFTAIYGQKSSILSKINYDDKTINNIKIEDIPTLIVNFNNDSLYAVYKYSQETAKHYSFGIVIDTLIDIKKNGYHIKTNNGNIWLYSIESSSTKLFSFRIYAKYIDKTSYLALYDINRKITETDIDYYKELKTDELLDQTSQGGKAIIEYYEEKHNDTKILKIKDIIYEVPKFNHIKN